MHEIPLSSEQIFRKGALIDHHKKFKIPRYTELFCKFNSLTEKKRENVIEKVIKSICHECLKRNRGENKKEMKYNEKVLCDRKNIEKKS